jgi:hypothetical protein
LESGDQAEHNTRLAVWQFDIDLVFPGGFALKLPNFQFSRLAGCEPKQGVQIEEGQFEMTVLMQFEQPVFLMRG